MKSRHPQIEGAARDSQSALASAMIIPHSAQQAKQARQRLWKRIIAATRDADTEALLEAHRARIASHAIYKAAEAAHNVSQIEPYLGWVVAE